jgi:hypothetical protein
VTGVRFRTQHLHAQRFHAQRLIAHIDGHHFVESVIAHASNGVRDSIHQAHSTAGMPDLTLTEQLAVPIDGSGELGRIDTSESSFDPRVSGAEFSE